MRRRLWPAGAVESQQILVFDSLEQFDEGLDSSSDGPTGRPRHRPSQNPGSQALPDEWIGLDWIFIFIPRAMVTPRGFQKNLQHLRQ